MEPLRSLPIVAVLLALAACGSPSASDDGTLRVAVCTPPQGHLVERIGGERVTVRLLLPPGASPATHQLSDADIARLMEADLLLRTGIPFEQGPWLEAVRRADGPRIVDLREGIDLLTMTAHSHHDHDHDGDHHHHHDHAAGGDPHIWLAPGPLIVQATTICEALLAADPDGEEGYRLATSELVDELQQLDAELARRLAPYRGRAFAVYHPAWSYLAAAYDLEQLAVEAGGQEPSDAELGALQRRLGEADISTLFVQSQVHGRSAERVAEACGLRLVQLDPLAADPLHNLVVVTDELVTAFSAAAP